MLRYFIINKPYQVLSQFTSAEGKQTLKDHFKVPTDVYAVGRLDYDSEGLLILTNDATLNHRLLNPQFMHQREYWAQVEGDVPDKALTELQKGVTISINGAKYHTQPCKATRLANTPDIWERNPPIRFRKEIPTSWIKLILTEGKNRQVRKMTAQTGFPTLRLIRYRIEGVQLQGLLPGELREMSKNELYRQLFG